MPAEELIVVGGGLVGAAIAYGAARAGAQVTLLDQGDIAHRASRGNFGLLWVQGKGGKAPAYARWTRDGVRCWPALASELRERTDIDVAAQQAGGFWIGFSDEEMEARQATLARIDSAVGGIPYEMLDRADLKARLPAIGTAVAGGSFCPLDGHANPLKLLHALHAGLKVHGAQVVPGVDITQVTCGVQGAGFLAVSRDGRRWGGTRLVLAAGLGNQGLAAQVGLHAPVLPKRGQVLVTERVQHFLHQPTNKVRQTNEGSIQLGSTTEEVGLDDGTTVPSIESLARKAVATFPVLAGVRLVRAWGSLRVMTPDGLPIYQESASCPGAFVATSHSGVTLAAAHALVVAPWMAGMAAAPDAMDDFAGDRFLAPNRTFADAH